MKTCRVCAGGVPERFDLARQEEIERFDLIGVTFPNVEVPECAHDCRATDRDTPDRWSISEREFIGGQTQRAADDT